MNNKRRTLDKEARNLRLFLRENILTTNPLKIINNKNNINISYDNEFKVINIKLDTSKRYIKSFIEKGLDITVVEILEEDNISKDYFLWDEHETDNDRIINNEIP